MKERLEAQIKETLKNLGIDEVSFVVEHPADLSHGDYSTNVAMVVGKQFGENPVHVAQKIKDKLEKQKIEFIERIEIAKPGFINFSLTKEFLIGSIVEILYLKEKFGV